MIIPSICWLHSCTFLGTYFDRQNSIANSQISEDQEEMSSYEGYMYRGVYAGHQVPYHHPHAPSSGFGSTHSSNGFQASLGGGLSGSSGLSHPGLHQNHLRKTSGASVPSHSSSFAAAYNLCLPTSNVDLMHAAMAFPGSNWLINWLLIILC